MSRRIAQRTRLRPRHAVAFRLRDGRILRIMALRRRRVAGSAPLPHLSKVFRFPCNATR